MVINVTQTDQYGRQYELVSSNTEKLANGAVRVTMICHMRIPISATNKQSPFINEPTLILKMQDSANPYWEIIEIRHPTRAKKPRVNRHAGLASSCNITGDVVLLQVDKPRAT
jgi:hypothetical protein